MKTFINAAVVATALVLLPGVASAGERINDAVVGGVSGLLVAGPVGLVAGGVIGYSAGPSIGRSLRGERQYRRRHYRNDHYRN